MEKVMEKELGLDESIGIRQIIKDNWKFLLGLCLVTFLLYVNSLEGDFVSDDYASIPQNPQVGNFLYMVKMTPLFLNWLTYSLFGYDSVFPYHLLSLFIYLITIILAFLLVEKVFMDRVLSRMSLLLYAFLPIHVEAVSWISGRIYMILAAYILAGLLFFIRMMETKKWIYAGGTVTMFLLAFLTDRPRPLSLIFLILLYLYYVNGKAFSINYKKFFGYGALIFSVVFILAYPAIVNRIKIVNSGYNGSGGVFYDPFFQYPTGISKYLQLMWAPTDLTLYHTLYTFPLWLNWTIILTMFSTWIYAWFKDRRYFFAITFFLLALAPSMAPVKVSWLVAERYAFLPSLGFAIFLGLFLADWWKKSRLAVSLVLVCLLGFYSVRTVLRNVDWQTNHKLWVNTCQVSPNSHNAWNNIGDDYDKLVQYDNAIKGFSQSTVVKSDYADAYHNRANIFFKTGRLDLARDSYNTALSYSPGLYQTYLSLTQIDMMEKNFDLALEHAQKAVELQPNSPQSWYVAGVVLAEGGQLEEAKKVFRKSLELNSTYGPSVEALNKMNQQL